MDMLETALGDAPEHTDAPASQAETAASPEVATGPARGPDGKFASTAASAPEQAGSDPASQAATAATDAGQPPAGYVPLATLLDQRDELKAAKARLAAYESQQQTQAPQAPPSVFDDEDAFIAHQQQQIQTVALNTRLDISEEMARGKHGDETVDAVQTWFAEKRATSPEFYQRTLSQRNPYEFAISEMKREQALSKIDPADLDDYAAWKASRAAAQGQPQPAAAHAAPRPSAAPPTPSLASASSAGGVQHVPSGPGQAFDAAIP